MNKPSFKFFKKTALYTLFLVSSCLAGSCTDEIPEESRFTFTGELIADHLEKNPEYSKFVSILKKANISKKAKSSIFKTLSTYGSYTCFAPTNDAIDAFLTEMAEDPESGIFSTDIELLDDSIATEIAKNHIIEKGYKTIDLSEGNIPKMTMNRRYINISISSDAKFVLDKTSKIEKVDIETENGIIQAIDKVINPSTKKIHEQILQHPELTLFGEAIMQTGLDSLLDIFEIDPYYENNESDVEANKYIEKEGEAFSPAERRQRYTVLIETNETFANPELNHLGRPLLTVEDLEEFAQKFYGEEAPGDYKNKKNALNKFMRYHIIDRQLAYEGTSAGSFIMENYNNGSFNSETNLPSKFDRYDYFETMLPYTLLKVTRPLSNTGPLNKELVINYAQDNGTRCMNAVQGVDMEKHINVIVRKSSDSGVKDFSQTALNGILHTIDKILVYNEDEMAGNILNERMRWDISSLFPEMTNNGIRWEDNAVKSTYIPDGYCERLVVNGVVDNTIIIYLRPSSNVSLGGYPNYQGDELLAIGRYDFKYRIPYVPEGNYEIRFGYSTSTERAITQFYYDGTVCGIPVDMTLDAEDPLIGWFDEKDLSSDDIKEKDKAMRNRGYMKGPASCVLTKDGENMRKSKLALRKIIGQFRITKGDHWLRFKNVTENEKSSLGNWVQFNQDYLEIVPVNIITNQTKPEDQN